MKLCTVCDRELKGRWCKNCRRFVKSYESNASIYEKEVQQKAGEADVRSLDDRTQKTAEGKKKKKAAFFGVGLSALLAGAGPFLSDFIDGIQIVSDRMKAEEEANRRYFEEEVMLSDEELEFHRNRFDRKLAIQKLTPADRVLERNHTVFYYHPEDIKELGYFCDEPHADLCLTTFEQWLSEQWKAVYEVTEDSSVYSNLCSAEGETIYFRFATYRDYRGAGDFSVRVDFDTATEQLHCVEFKTKGETPDILLCHNMLRKFDSLTRFTVEDFEVALKEALNRGEYATLYESKSARVVFVTNNEGYAVMFYPVKKEW